MYECIFYIFIFSDLKALTTCRDDDINIRDRLKLEIESVWHQSKKTVNYKQVQCTRKSIIPLNWRIQINTNRKPRINYAHAANVTEIPTTFAFMFRSVQYLYVWAPSKSFRAYFIS